MPGFLKRAYFSIGIHTAPENTLCWYINKFCLSLFKFMQRKDARADCTRDAEGWYKIIDREGRTFVRSYEGLFFKEKLEPHENVVFDIDYAIEHFCIKRIGLIFFMGLGDYLFVTPFLEQLHRRYPSLQIDAHVSRNMDSNNNPAVVDLLRLNPVISNVYLYEGSRDGETEADWRNYDYWSIFKDLLPDTLAVPLIYEYGMHVRSRAKDVCKRFGVGEPTSLLPLIHLPKKRSEEAHKIISAIENACNAAPHKPIVFLQLEQRSTRYRYPHSKELVSLLIDEGSIVVSVTSSDVIAPHYFEIDIQKVSILESLSIISALKDRYADRLSMIALPSVFGVVSSGLNITNLQLQHYYDRGLGGLWFPNITVLTNLDYATIPEDKVILAEPGSYTLNENRQINYKPTTIISAWKRMLNVG